MRNSSIWPMDLSGALHSPKLQYYWSFTIRLFNVISKTLVEGSCLWAETLSVYSTIPVDWAEMVSHHIQDARCGMVVIFCRDAADTFYSPSRLSWDGLVSYPRHSLWDGLPFCRDAVGAFHSLSRLRWDSLVSYPKQNLERSYLSAKVQSVYSTASGDLAEMV